MTRLSPPNARWLYIFAAAVQQALEAEPLERVSRRRLTATQFHLLRLVSATGLDRVGVAAGFLGVSPPALTKNIDKLVRLGLVTRKASSADRRALLLRATPRGRALVERHDAISASRLNRALRALKRGETEDLARLLQVVSLELLRHADIRRGQCLRCAGYVAKQCEVAHLRGGCPYQADSIQETRPAGR
jgi:DNA-binding MarR family transcriptional regulator